MKNPIRWTVDTVKSSLEREIAAFDAFEERSFGRKQAKRAGKRPLSLECLVLKYSGTSRVRPSRRLLIGTYLAVMIFLGLVALEAVHVVELHQPEEQLLDGITAVVSFIAGTYWGRHA